LQTLIWPFLNLSLQFVDTNNRSPNLKVALPGGFARWRRLQNSPQSILASECHTTNSTVAFALQEIRTLPLNGPSGLTDPTRLFIHHCTTVRSTQNTLNGYFTLLRSLSIEGTTAVNLEDFSGSVCAAVLLYSALLNCELARFQVSAGR